jgi:hypothetical protein
MAHEKEARLLSMIKEQQVLYCILKVVLLLLNRVWGSVVVKALRYRSEGPGIDSRDFFRGI